MKKYFVLFVTLCLSQWALSQASLEISLVDSSKNPVADQLVLLKNPQIGVQRQGISSKNGKVQFNGLSTSGLYTIEIAGGSFFQAKKVENISLISDKVKTVTVVLKENVQAIEAVTITADEFKTINTVDAEVASELDSREIEDLPVEGRDITRSLYRLPNITQATGFFPEAPTVAINGANPLYTNYQIDGMGNNENFLGGQRFKMPVGFTKSITALTNNFSAEHGLTSNGIINITSKSGTNETHGEAFYMTRPGPVIDSPSPYAQRDLSGNQVKDGFQRHQAGFALGGALVKDKTFYFLNVEHTLDLKENLLNVPELGINETVKGQNQFTYISGKLDHYWSDRFRSSLRVNTGLINIDFQGGGLEGGVTFPSAGYKQDRNSLNVALKNTYSGQNFTYEGNYLYGRFRWNYSRADNPDSPNVTVLAPNEQPIAVLGHPGFTFDDIENTHIVQQKVTFHRADHNIKTGVQFKTSHFSLFGGGNTNGSYTVKLNEDQLNGLANSNTGSDLMPGDIPGGVEVQNYSVELQPNAFEHRQNIYSIYLEDQWTVGPNLNLNIGVRYDYDDLSKGGGSQGDLNNIAPRLSANYKLNENSSIRAGYGIYYDKILYAIYSDALSQNSNSADYQAQIQELIDQGVLPEDTDISQVTNDGNISATVANTNYLQGPQADELQSQRESNFQNELRILNPNGYDNPYSHQFMLGYQQKLNENMVFYVDAMHNRSYDLFRLRNLNAPSSYPIDPENVEVRPQVEADLTRPVPIFTDSTGTYTVINGQRRDGVARNVVMTETEGRSNYYALNFTLQKDKGDDNYSYRFIYTLSYLENNTEDINFRAMDNNNFEAEWGPSINDRRHVINAFGTYYPIENLSITLASLMQSGQPINRIPDATIYGTTDLNGDGQSFSDAYVGNSDRSPGEDRNSDRLPWSVTFDASIYYKIPLGESDHLELGAQVFNLFNAENLSGYANNATQSNQLQVGPSSSGVLVRRNAAPPRQFQFSLRYIF